jgi:hypothetical protein
MKTVEPRLRYTPCDAGKRRSWLSQASRKVQNVQVIETENLDIRNLECIEIYVGTVPCLGGKGLQCAYLGTWV